MYYHYIKGSAALCEGETPDERRLREFDELYTAWRLASRKGYLYFEGNGVQGLANLMASPDNYAFFQDRRSHALTRFGVPVDSLLPMRLGQLALQKFSQYKDLYQIAGAYVSIGKYLNAHSHYTEALDTLKLALECVNDHHRLFYDCHDSLDWLKAFDRRDTICAEKAWMEQKLKTVPEWISRIREQLSVSYAGLGMKKNQTITAIFTWISLKIHARIKNWKAAIRHWKRRRDNSTSCCHWSLWASCLYPSSSGFSTSVPKTGTECISAVCS